MLHSGISPLWIVQLQQRPNIGVNERWKIPYHPHQERQVTVAYASDSHILGNGFAHRFSGVWEDYKVARAKRKLYRQTLRELRELGNSELADLGLSRSSITRVARDAAGLE